MHQKADCLPRVTSVLDETRGGDRQREMRKEDGIKVLIVERLGQPALIVNTSGPRLLLLDDQLTCEQRMEIMNLLIEGEVA